MDTTNSERLETFQGRRKRAMREISITVREVQGHCGAGHREGDTFSDGSADRGRICPFAWHTMLPFMITLRHGGSFPWRYQGTRWEKPDGGTEFIRCPDPVNRVVFEIRVLDSSG